MLRAEELLRLIWQDGVTFGAEPEMRAFGGALSEIVPVGTQPLLLRGGHGKPMLLADDVELMPALPLGDVLAEELSLDLPYGTLVALLPDRPRAPGMQGWSNDLGFVVGECLLHAVNNGTLPVERHTDALFVMAQSAGRLVSGPRLRDRSVEPRAFCLGLGQSLGLHWRGGVRSGAPAPGLFSDPDFLWQAQLRGSLRDLDPGFAAPDTASGQADLLRPGQETLSLANWVTRMEAVLCGVLGMPQPGAVTYPGDMPRINLQ